MSPPPQNAAHSAEVLASLVRIGNLLNTERNFDLLLDTIVNEAIRLLGAQRGSLFLLDGEQLWSRVATGLNKGQRIRFERHVGIAGEVVSSSKPLNIPDAYADPRFNKEVDKTTGFRTLNILCVPLITVQGNTIGAFELLNKPAGFTQGDQELLSTLATQASIAIENVQLYEQTLAGRDTLAAENLSLKSQLKGRYAYPTIVGGSQAIQKVTEAIHKVAATEANVLILGESGTGKELIARAIHAQSARANKPLIALNCAALPESLLESELFGIERGVATGVTKRMGYLEKANGGTLFLDEVGDMPLSTQVKLLRVLQERTFTRLGGETELRVDIRVISATNRDFKRAIAAGDFREDLFYRLNVFPIHLPPLRARPTDIPILAKFILNNVLEKLHCGKKVFSPDCLEAMVVYPWPGNVREMENVIERAVILADGVEVDVRPLLQDHQAHPAQPQPLGGEFLTRLRTAMGEGNLKGAVAVLETEMITQALEHTQGNQMRAARLLGLSREGLRKKTARLHPSTPSATPSATRK